MEKRNKNIDSRGYSAVEKRLWNGRATDSETIEYWYQGVKLIDLFKDKIPSSTKKKQIGLLGYSCDEGVRRNQGRVGASYGPEAIREKLAKLPLHFHDKELLDVGNIYCVNEEMEESQHALQDTVSMLLKSTIFPIVLGGGHDVAYGHFNGIKNALFKTDNKKIGIVNLDAHFDLRPLKNKGNSGTPFYQISHDMKESADSFNYFVLGIQKQSNTSTLFQTAEDFGVKYVLSAYCHLSNLENIKEQLRIFIEPLDYIYVTIDMDGFSSIYAPGVSAPSSLGFEPYFAIEVLKYLFNSGKVISCDIAEMNPNFDIDGKTARLAAKLIDTIACIL